MMNKRLQPMVYSAVTLAVLIICALLPRGVASEAQGEPEASVEPLTISQKTHMFLECWNNGIIETEGTEYRYEELTPEDLSGDEISRCIETKDRLWDSFVFDSAPDEYISLGEDNFKLIDHRGREVRLCRLWYEWSGSWDNWFDLLLDIDSGMVYYFYLSSGFQNSSSIIYTDTDKEVVFEEDHSSSAISAAYRWAKLSGYECVSAAESGDYANDGAPIYTAIYVDGDEVVRYGISYKYYPLSLLDVKFIVR